VLFRSNKRLKKNLGLKEHQDYDLIAARVVSYDPVNYFRSVIIDKGGDSGIMPDLPVIAFFDSREALVGRVVAVNRSSSKILLITDELSAVPAQVINSEENGLIQGRNTSRLEMDYLFPETRVKIGDEIMASGMGEIFPYGLYIGVVGEVKSSERGYFKKALVKPHMKLNKLKEVFILKKSGL
jgi:rod shape-determining protein MreC